MLIVVGNDKGGVGKTRLSIHLAMLALTAGLDAILLDTDRQGSSMDWCQLRRLEKVDPPITVMSLPDNPLQELTSLSSKYDMIVVDIGAKAARTMFECALVADLVLVPCGNDQMELDATLRVFDAMRGLDPQHRKGRVPAYVVLTKVSHLPNARATLDLRELFASEGIPVLRSQVASREAWKATGKTGRALHELKPRDYNPKAEEEVRAVYEEALELMTLKTV